MQLKACSLMITGKLQRNSPQTILEILGMQHIFHLC